MAVAIGLDSTAGYAPAAMLGSFRVLECLAQGGMASVFRAIDSSTGDLVALKTVRGDSPADIAGLKSEIATLRQLRHPGVVRFRAAGESHGIPWMALDLLRGRTLFDEIVAMWTHPMGISSTAPANATDWVIRLQSDPALSWPRHAPAAGLLRDALTLFARLAEALDYVHRRGIVHCDVKPPNVFVGNVGQVTLLDFGLARPARKRREAADANHPCMGTMEYVAPEHLCGRAVDARTDVYSLGCVLYELVTGRPPFHDDAIDEIVRGHLDVTPMSPSSYVSGVPTDLENLILEMLAKEPAERPRHAGAVAARVRTLRARVA